MTHFDEGSEDYLCSFEESIDIEAYEHLPSFQQCFYAQTFEKTALAYLNLTGIATNDYSPGNCFVMY
jgi:hypothetical protein